MRSPIRLMLLTVLCLLTGAALQAQPGQDPFGKSRIQYKDFDWKLYSTPNFNVYFYQGGESTAKNAAEYAEKEIKRITSLIGYYPYSKVTLILYNSSADLKQSNIGLYRDQFQTGNETLFQKNKLELAFHGTQTEFKRDLSYKLTQLLLGDMMYGGSLKEALQSSYLLRLPDWFVSGVAAYTAEGWSMRMDNYIRDILAKETNPKPEQLFSRNPELAGQSVWNYVAERYGYNSIQNILNLTRITRDIEIGITSSLNISYSRFLQDWQNYYAQINRRPEDPFVSMPNENRLFRKNKDDLKYTEPVLNPDGSLLAYAEKENGVYKIIVHDLQSKSSRVVWKGGHKTLDQPTDHNTPVLAWRSNGQLAFVENRRGKVMLRQVSSRRIRSRIAVLDDMRTPAVELSQFSQVRDMSFSDDGKLILMSAVKDGQTDIYLLQGNGRLQGQLTNDIYDDLSPVFLKDNKGVVFSSNRYVSETDPILNPKFEDVVNNYDIFWLKSFEKQAETEQLTSSIASELRPRATADGNFVYIGEQNGIRSLYKYNINTKEDRPLTNFVQNIEAYDYVVSKNTLAFVAKDNARDFIYVITEFTPVSTAGDLPKTSRQVILEARARVSRAQPVKKPAPVTSDTLSTLPKRQEGDVNIDNYQFENEQKENAAVKNKVAVAPTTTKQGLQLAGPKEYDLRFSVDDVITSVYSDPQLGFGIVAGVNMSDLFENHRIRGNAYLRTDFETSRVFAEYINLASRIDYGIQFKRDIVVGYPESTPNFISRFAKNEVAPLIVYPLSYSTSIRVQPRFINTRLAYMHELAFPDTTNNHYGGNIEFVYDNTLVTGINMMEGSRMKVGFFTLKDLASAGGNFNKFYFDLRHYQKIYKQITLAGRISYGAYFGNSPKTFLIGGMDNWLFPSDGEDSENNAITTLSGVDFFFMEYVTPMRGFNFNTRSGSKHLLANLELRIPVIQSLYGGAVQSGFFRNLQLTAFADAGSAYNGTNPFTGRNSINTRIVGGSGSGGTNPFEITVINYRNPFLVGYGFGARSTLFGVYGKVDMAWGEDNEGRNGPKFYITLGYDF
jgi:Tol biopolymer transport system component